MAKHLSVGKIGEALATAYLIKCGFRVIHQNWRYGHWEIDIIAEKENILHFIEVKTRRNTNYGYPEQSVNSKKLNVLAAAATEYQYQYPQWTDIQFDILSILLNQDGTEEYFFIEDISL